MIPLDLIAGLLPARAAPFARGLVTGAKLLALGLLTWHGTPMALRVRNQNIAMLDVPIARFYAAIPVGALLAIPDVLLAYVAPRPDPDRATGPDPAGKDTA